MGAMHINPLVLNAVKSANAKLLVVTKYWDPLETKQLIARFAPETCVLGWGENRTDSLIEKKLPRAQTHFIGRLQSRQLPTIVEHCQFVHSLASLKHAEKLNKLAAEKNLKVQVFIQVNVGADPSKEGISAAEVSDFIESLTALEHLQVVGLSSMGWGEFEENQKRNEFKQLVTLRDQYVPQGQTSAGTSRDYPLALEEGIDIVRVGREVVL